MIFKSHILGNICKLYQVWLCIHLRKTQSQVALLIRQSIFDYIDFLHLRVLNEMIYGLSINKEENTLISCGQDNQILIMQGSRQMEWQIKQKIKLDGEGYRIVFITNELFGFQSKIPRNRLFLYQLDENTQVINKLQDIIVKDSLPSCLYRQQKNSYIQKWIESQFNKMNILSIKLNTQLNLNNRLWIQNKWLAIWYYYTRWGVFDHLGSKVQEHLNTIILRKHNQIRIKLKKYQIYIFSKLLKIIWKLLLDRQKIQMELCSWESINSIRVVTINIIEK
ncbi:unnamed protein product [Paramecium primaurelia]|uniref:Uncharacterized protein n=1 Tax=Paramecium primaurelia TaxID=5886 RepID=A0A8S1PRB5_PARPR|nr:unnamed protein product [Paramecium primaurelia]